MTRRAVIATAVTGLVIAAALLVASLSAPVELVNRPLNTAAASRPTLPPLTRTPQTFATAPSGESEGHSWFGELLGVLLVVLAVVVVAVILGLVVAAVRRVLQRPVVTAHEEALFDVPLIPHDLLGRAASRMALLEAGEPRNAIVAAWLDLEQAAGETGLPRQRAETSTEYAARVLGTWQVDGRRLHDLGSLYREARFSVHELSEAHRRRALDDLRVLHADLERVARAQRESLHGGQAQSSSPTVEDGAS